MKRYINIRTGEIIKRHTRRGAYRYFKRDGKRFNYAVAKGEVLSETEFEFFTAIGLLKVWLEYLRQEKADGNA